MKTVSVIIPAYNEEKNIKKILIELLDQQIDNFELKEILVIIDGCSDDTQDIAEKLEKENPVIQVISDGQRKGVAKRMTEITKEIESDIIIRFDADVLITDDQILEKITKAFTEKVGLVCGNVQVSKPKNFVQKIGYFGKNVWNEVRDNLKADSISYRCHGGLYAISQDFAKEIKIPKDIGADDDTYLFFDALRKGFGIKYIKDAIVYQHLPMTISDYINQHVRYDIDTLSPHFSKKLLANYRTIRKRNTVPIILKNLIKQPVLGLFYSIIRSYILIKSKFHKPTTKWIITETTKEH